MAEVSTTPAPANPAADVGSSTFDSKLDAKLAKIGLIQPADAEPAQPKEPVEATPEAAEGELLADDLPVDEQEPTGDEWLELDRKGEKRKVSKEEAKRLAQQGWDYSDNQQKLKADTDALEQVKAALQAKAQITPQVVDAAANVRYFERALQQYNGFDWQRHAQDDPIQYIQTKAQFDQLRDGYGASVGQFQQAIGTAQQVDQVISQAELQQQFGKVFDAAPELRDTEKFKAETGRIRGYLKEMGISDDEANRLYDARHLLIVRDAMRYRQAVKAKAERQANPATPTLRPGAAPQRQTAATQTAEVVKQLHQAKDPLKKRELFDKALEKKLARFG